MSDLDVRMSGQRVPLMRWRTGQIPCFVLQDILELSNSYLPSISHLLSDGASCLDCAEWTFLIAPTPGSTEDLISKSCFLPNKLTKLGKLQLLLILLSITPSA